MKDIHRKLYYLFLWFCIVHLLPSDTVDYSQSVKTLRPRNIRSSGIDGDMIKRPTMYIEGIKGNKIFTSLLKKLISKNIEGV